MRLLSTLSSRKEVPQMEFVITFLISVAAGVAANRISKWLDEDHK